MKSNITPYRYLRHHLLYSNCCVCVFVCECACVTQRGTCRLTNGIISLLNVSMATISICILLPYFISDI